MSFDTLVASYVPSSNSTGIVDTTWLFNTYMNCVGNPANSEQLCAAYDKCVVSRYPVYGSSAIDDCNYDYYLDPYIDDSWISGSCSDTTSNEP